MHKNGYKTTWAWGLIDRGDPWYLSSLVQ